MKNKNENKMSIIMVVDGGTMSTTAVDA